MGFSELAYEFSKKDSKFMFNIVEKFCEKHEIIGPDGLAGLLNLVKRLYIEQRCKEEVAIIKSFGEIAYSLWALEKLGYISYADRVAQNFKKGGDFGDTSRGGNYFRNFEVELQLGLRFLEEEYFLREGDVGEPDYLIESNQFVVEIKAPASKIALLQDIIKAVKQIEGSGMKGVIVLVLDHMVARGMIEETMEELPKLIKEIILSVLPTGEHFNTIGVVVEWVNWGETTKHPSTIQPIMNDEKHAISENREIIRKVWQTISFDDITNLTIYSGTAKTQFNYNIEHLKDLNVSEAGSNFYNDEFESCEDQF